MPSEKYNPAEAKLRFRQHVIEQIALKKKAKSIIFSQKNLKLLAVTDFNPSPPLISHFY